MLSDFLRHWLPIALVVTVLPGTSVAIGQQILRQGANDPQVQLAEDVAARVQAGVAPTDVLPSRNTDIATSLDPWVLIYGSDRKLIAGSARLDGVAASYPTSVFDNAPAGGSRDEVTWQPRAGVRAATVVIGFKGGWVVAGRSLRLVEERESGLEGIALAAWLVGLAATAAAVLGAAFLARRLEER